MKALNALKEAADHGFAYDQMLEQGNAKGNALIMAGINGLIDQTKSFERVRAVLDLNDIAFEVNAEQLQLLTFYSRNLGVPIRVNYDLAQVLRGKRQFYLSGCVACHQPKYVTSRLDNQPEQSFQLIWPYTDMLLHDMGEELADQGTENPLAREWRTSPLWGIGLTEQVSKHSNYLHDGRVRNLTEAILWHGGESEASANRFAAMSPVEREDLLTFLRSSNALVSVAGLSVNR